MNIGTFVETLEVVPLDQLAQFSEGSAQGPSGPSERGAIEEVVGPVEGDATVMATSAERRSPACVDRS